MADAWRQRAILACAAAAPLLLAGADSMPASASATVATKVTAEDGPSCGVGAPANGFCWVPSSLTFQESGAVEWQSQSTANHYVEADDQSWGGRVDLNHTFARSFNPGTYRYHCAYHPKMTGVIYVREASSSSSSSSSSSTSSTGSGSTTFTVPPPSSTSTSTTASRSTSVSTQTTTDVASDSTVDSASTGESTSSATTSGQPPVAPIGASGHSGGGRGSSGAAIAVSLLAVLAAAGGGAAFWRRRYYRFGIRIPRG